MKNKQFKKSVQLLELPKTLYNTTTVALLEFLPASAGAGVVRSGHLVLADRYPVHLLSRLTGVLLGSSLLMAIHHLLLLDVGLLLIVSL